MEEYELFDTNTLSKKEEENIISSNNWNEKERNIQQIFDYFSLSQLSFDEQQFYSSLLLSAFEALNTGNFSFTLEWNKDLDYYASSYVGKQVFDIFPIDDVKSWTLTDKLGVFVVYPAENKAYFYFQKHWNTYLRLSEIMKIWHQPNQIFSFYWESQKIQNLIEKFNILLNTEQKEAVLKTLNSQFNIITGGPGTGKTTVASLILEGFLCHNPNAKVAILTPTGRASARLKESIENTLQKNEQGAIALDYIKAGRFQIQTIHSFLIKMESLYKERNQTEQNLYLSLDMLMIDEISMVSTFLFEKLMSWISPKTKVVLIGDPYQLPSVEEGFLLGYFLFPGSRFLSCTYELKTLIRSSSKDLSDLILYCQNQIHSKYLETKIDHWKTPESIKPIGLLEFEKLCKDQSQEGVFFLELEGEVEQSIRPILDIYTRKYEIGLNTQNSEYSYHDYYQRYFHSQILSPTKEGNMGTKSINEYCYHIVLKNVFTKQPFYIPIFVEKNQSHLGLFNGDTGLLEHLNLDLSQEKLIFPRPGKELIYHKNQVQNIDQCFAMTVHKSQGSEFQEVILFLPSYAVDRIFSEEIFYTGISRAKKRVILVGKKEVLEKGLANPYKRENGLPL